MEFDRSSGGVIRSAGKIFRLGSVTWALAVAALVSLTSALGGFVRGDYGEQSFEVILFMLSIVISSVSVWRGAGPLNARRSIWLGSLTALPSAVVLTTLRLGGVSWDAAAAVSVYPAAYLRAVVAPAMGAKEDRTAVCSLSALIPAVPSVMSGYGVGMILTSLTLAVAAAALTWEVVGEISGSLLGCGGVESLRALTAMLLADDPTVLERCLERLGVQGKCSVLVVESDPGILVAPDFHPGPLDGAGSSDGPATILEEIEKGGRRGMYLRRASTHSRNLCTREDVMRVVRAINSARRFKVLVGRPIMITDGTFTVTAQSFSGLVLVTVSGHPRSMEDVPKSVEERLKRRLRLRGLEAIPLVIDRHDSLADPERAMRITPFSEEEDSLVNLLERAVIEAAGAEGTRTPRVGLGAAQVDLPSVGRGGIRVLYLEVLGDEIAYVCIDGNNMIPELGTLIRRRISELGITPIICTTDTHATLKPNRPVNQVGSEGAEKWGKIASTVESAVREAVSRAEPSEMECSLTEVNVCFAGVEAMNGLSYAAEVAGYGLPLLAMGLILPTLALAAALAQI